MLAKLSAQLPKEGQWLFEPKWDGFRAIVFRDGDEVYIQSREKKPLLRYFPELRAPFLAHLPPRCVIDGEVVVARHGRLEFETLQTRLHPAKSRIDKLAAETPSSFVAFDLIALGDENLCELPQVERRRRLELVLANAAPPVFITPVTQDRAIAEDWFSRFEGAGLDGVMAKAIDLTYQPKKRAMLKIKHARTADCVLAGFRWHKNGPGTLVGSLMLGVYDSQDVLHHVGITSSFTMARRAELVEELAPLRTDALEAHPWNSWAASETNTQRRPSGSRWSRGKDLSWEPLRIERVVEVKFDHLQGTRFRHASTFRRWRDDKCPQDCRYDQFEVTPPFELQKIFGAKG